MAPRILVAEDSPTQAAELRHLLEEGGYTVTVAPDGEQALAAALRDPPALVISDILMPRMDGYTLCQRIKSDASLKDTPVVVVTVLSGARDIIRALQCGADGFIRKPYDEEELLSRVRYVQANRALRKSERVQPGVEIEVGGQRYFVSAERRQILDLLISTYEEAVNLNEELAARERELERAAGFLRGLYRVAKALNQASGERELAEAVLEQALGLPGVQAGWISLREGETGFRVSAARGLPPALAAPGALEGDCLCRRRLLSGELDRVTNILDCERLERAQGDTRGLRRHVSVPLWIDGRTLGVLNLAGSAPGTFRDEDLEILNGIGNQVAVALERTRLQEHLKAEVIATETHLAIIHDSVLDSVFLLSVEPGDCYRFRSVNRAFLTVTGLSRGRVVGKRVEEVLPESSHALVIGKYQEAIRERRSVRWEETAAFPAGMRVGEVTVTPIADEAGAVTQLVGTVHDITERKRTEETLRQREKLAALGELLAGVAHELNNPLSAVLGQAYLLQQTAGEGPLGARAEKIARAADRCARIVKNFLALAREYPPEREDVDLGQVVREAVGLLAYPLRVDDVEVRLDLAGDLPLLWADPHQLHQVVVNLVANAHQAMRQAGPSRRLLLATRADPVAGQVWIEVTDTGPGIPPEIQARMFDPFFTTKPPGQGTGLGLSLCRGIVEAHGGSIHVESAPGRGATFRVELPVRAPQPPSAAAGDARSAALPSPTGGWRILVVDDETEVADLLAEMLSADGHHVDTAANGAAALEKLREGAYDLILSDVRMPELDGPGLYRELARRQPELLPRLVFLTGDTLSAEIARFLEETGASSVNKPFVLDDIRRVIRRTLGAG